MFEYSFPAVKGSQAKAPYYICMIPCKFLKKLFPISDNSDVLAEYRAQRKLNEKRIPEIKNYIIGNRNSYVFSALAASIDGDFYFNETSNSLGMLMIDMNSSFLINDGQHRNAAIQAAIYDDETLGEETIPVVFFLDKNLERSQQMFTDLNKYAVRPSKSQNALYDHKDDIAILSRNIVFQNDFLKNYTDFENDTIGINSAKLFTLNNFYNANKKIIGSNKLDNTLKKFCTNYWNLVVKNISEWNDLISKNIYKKTLRTEYIITQGVVLIALGKLGNYFFNNKEKNMITYIKKLSDINWLRSNRIWNNRTIVNGRISRKDENINLTYIKIKELIGLELNEHEKKMNEIR